MRNMMKWSVVALTTALVAGCATSMDDGGWESPAGLLGDGSGYQPLLMVRMPLSTCDHAAFVKGFKYAYVPRWNQHVNAKVLEYTTAVSQPQHSAAAQKGLALYKSRLIGAVAGVNPADYPNRCQAESYKSGLAEGVRAADANLNLLAQDAQSRTP